ncbi:uncharacterized protein RCC_08820 [Ramularia collo-cygni]|uniref:Uncharacterized protein n=1 Tax=Ramularia collo-cygni TaxID=112498 RepID=A0A2D3V869_9PEZI|nr:uncharacterized protein RCC_08820 [Ramularia collo-cygni]CZT23110.1 uncharacterized protein RCC_08820 [Ramularia collo-cygni]
MAQSANKAPEIIIISDSDSISSAASSVTEGRNDATEASEAHTSAKDFHPKRKAFLANLKKMMASIPENLAFGSGNGERSEREKVKEFAETNLALSKGLVERNYQEFARKDALLQAAVRNWENEVKRLGGQ